MQAGVLVLDTYRSARALTAVGVMEIMQGKVTPRSLFDADPGQISIQAALRIAREADELGSTSSAFPSITTRHCSLRRMRPCWQRR